MKITVIGSGYVGLVTGVGLASLGHEVVCVDRMVQKIAQLKNGVVPIYEPGLKELLDKAIVSGKILFTDDLAGAIKDSPAIFIAVGTPQGQDGSADLSYVLAAAEEIAQNSNETKLIITKSTVPAGTGAMVRELVEKINPAVKFLVASNPEFLREGSAVADFMNPERIVIGIDEEKSEEILREIYAHFADKIVVVDVVTAELIKYAANSFLATKIAFINEMADLCERLGGNVRALSKAVGMDSRIGEKFLNPGPGFGGSCFPKDILAILNIAKNADVNLSIVDAVEKSNAARKIGIAKRAVDILGGVNGKKIALLGLAFKGNTDDIRYSPALVVAKELLKQGAKIAAHDFAAIENAKVELAEFSGVEFFYDPFATLKDVDLIVIATEWNQYGKLDLEKIKTISNCRKILDLRNMLNGQVAEDLGFEYYCIG